MNTEKKSHFKKRLVLLAVAMLAIGLLGCNGDGLIDNKHTDYDIVTETAFKIDTVVSITLYDWNNHSAIDKAFNEIDRLDKLLNVNSPGSDSERLFRFAGKEYIDISEEALEVIYASQKYSDLSGGLFDITAGPLISLWNIKDGKGHLPESGELTKVLPLIGYDKIMIDGNKAMLKDPGMKINLGAIAKGYIADQVKEILINEGVEHAIINLGGNIVAIGDKPEGKPFVIGVQDPFKSTGDIIAMVEVDDMSLVSSGNYERYFVEDGVRYHHILDPKTGFPSDSGLAGITIISEKSIEGDALSTAVFLLGFEKGMELIKKLDGIEAVFVTASGDIIPTPGLDGKLHIN